MRLNELFRGEKEIAKEKMRERGLSIMRDEFKSLQTSKIEESSHWQKYLNFEKALLDFLEYVDTDVISRTIASEYAETQECDMRFNELFGRRNEMTKDDLMDKVLRIMR